MRRLYVIKLGETFPALAMRGENFEHWTLRGLGASDGRTAVVCPRNGDSLPDPQGVAGAVLTGAHEMVTDRHDWSESTAEWIRAAAGAETPMLGICYGHQLLAHALGGRVGANPNGPEFGTATVRLNEAAAADELLAGLPDEFDAQMSHSQSVLELPGGAVRLAGSDLEACHAFRAGQRVWGLQFHPEFSAAVMRHYIHEMAGELHSAGRPVNALTSGVTDTPAASGVLRRFAELVL